MTLGDVAPESVPRIQSCPISILVAPSAVNAAEDPLALVRLNQLVLSVDPWSVRVPLPKVPVADTVMIPSSCKPSVDPLSVSAGVVNVLGIMLY